MAIAEALANIKSPRGLGWDDQRARSPKALGDWSGVILGGAGVGASNKFTGIQQFDYDTLSHIYITNDLIWTCINIVSSTVALAKLKVRIRDGKSLTYVPDHPLQKMLDLCNGSMTQFDLLQSYVVHQMLYGNVSMLLFRGSMTEMCAECVRGGETDCIHRFFINNTGPVVQIMPVYPEHIKQMVLTGTNKTYFFWCPNGATGTQYPIHPDNIITDPYYNPAVGWYGVSPVDMLRRWVNLDVSMTQQLNEFFENGSIPSMLVSLKPGANFNYDGEPDTLVAKMKENWMSKFSGNGKEKRSPAFVYGDIEVQRIQENIKETIGKEIYYEIQGRICATLGVPPTVFEMGLKYGSQKANAVQGERDFYNRTISIILARILNKMNQLVVPSYNTPGLELAWDLSEMGVAAFLIEAKETKVIQHWEKGLLKRDEARLLLAYEETDDELGDDYYRITVMGDGQNNVSNQLDKNLSGDSAETPPPSD